MLNRVKSEYASSSVTIPRKGRIRVILVSLGFILAVLLFIFRPGGPQKSASSPASQKAKQNSPSAIKKETDRALKKLSGKKTLKSPDVAFLLNKFPPRLSHVRDTVALHKKDITLHYSLDTALQHYGRILMNRYHPKYGAIAAIDPVTGRILCLTSYGHKDEPYLGDRLYSSSMFPAASIFKIVTAAGAVELAGIKNETMLKQVGKNHTLYTFQLKPVLKRYREISFADAFAYSINPVFGRLGIYALGNGKLETIAKRFGFGSPLPCEVATEMPTIQMNHDSSFILAEIASGFNQDTRISPLFGAMLTSAICEKGRVPLPTLVDSISSPESAVPVYQAAMSRWKTPIQPATADEVKKLMMKVTRYGTARKSFRDIKRSSRFKEMEFGGKTGNVDRDGIGRVDWFVGFARHPQDPEKRIAIGVVTVHGPYWTIHSSYIGASMINRYIRTIDRKRERAASLLSKNAEKQNG